MQLLTKDDAGRPVQINAAWALRDARSQPLLFWAFVACATLAIAAVVSSFWLPLWMSGVFFPVLGGALWLLGWKIGAGFGLLWLFHRPDVRLYLHQVVTLAEENMVDGRTDPDYLPWTVNNEFVKTESPMTGILLFLSETVYMPFLFYVGCHLLLPIQDINREDTNAQGYQRISHTNTFIMAKGSWLTNVACAWAMKSPHLQNVAILLPLEGRWDGSAHERLTLLSALESHKARLVPDTERAENAPRFKLFGHAA